jgi:lysozyme
MTRQTVFDAIKAERGGKPWDAPEIALIDGLLTRLGIPKEGRTTSETGKALIKSFEGVVLRAYPDPATGGDPWTAGVGHTGPDVRKGMTVTQAMVDAWLAADLRKFEDGVNSLALVTTQPQFDAMVSLAFNIGLGNFGSSTLLRKHKAGDYDGAAEQFGAWNKAAGKVMDGLTRRRAAEAALYRSIV